MRTLPWGRALGLVAATRVALVGVGVIAAIASGRDPAWAMWREWDANIYLEIAEHGYHGEVTDAWAEAFLPLFPLTLRVLMAIGIPPVPAGMLVTTAASVVAVAYLLRTAEQAGVRPQAAALHLLLFPTAVFLVAPYTEALFLAGAIAAFHHARRDQWGAAGIGAAVAAGTRVVGAFVLVGLAVTLVRSLRSTRSSPEAGSAGRRRLALRGAGGLALGAAPVAAYLAWLWLVRGDPLFLLTAQREGWGRRLTPPWDAFEATWRAAADADGWLAWTWPLEIVAVAVAVAVVVAAVRWRDWDYLGFLVPTVALVVSSTWFYSVPRILLTFFPLAIYLAGWTQRSRWREGLVLAVLGPLAALGTVAFTRGTWWF